MAKIGLKNFKYAKYDEDGKLLTGGPLSLGKAVSCKVAIDKNEAELYADDGLAESDYSFKKGTITLEVDEDADTVFADLLGHKISEETENKGEVIRNANDTAPFVAVGRILTKLVKGVRQYKVEFLHKVKFKEPDADETTKGESLEFKTSSIEGAISQMDNGDWSKAKTFTTYAEAETYLNGLLTAKA
jgi:phi13 family phage major tail protein